MSPLDDEHLPTLSMTPIATSAVALADGQERPEQRPQQRRVFTVVRSGGGEAEAALAVVEQLLASHGDSLWIVGVAPIEAF